MQTLTAAKVYLLTTQVIDRNELLRFLTDHRTLMPERRNLVVTDADSIPEIAGRVCYMSFGEKAGRKENADYLQHILESGHGSVLEHTVFGLMFTGVSRSLTHELVRHRAGWAYSQLSQRYVDSADANLVLPPATAQGSAELKDTLVSLIEQHQEASLKLYDTITDKLADSYAAPDKLFDFAVREGFLVRDRDLATVDAYMLDDGSIDMVAHRDVWIAELTADEDLRARFRKATMTARRKSAREAARCVLPNATETKIFVTANARALRHFLELRGNVAAEQEVRALAVQLLHVLKSAAPNIFNDMTAEQLPDGTSRVVSLHKKV